MSSTSIGMVGLDKAIARGATYLSAAQLQSGSLPLFLWIEPEVADPVLDAAVFHVALIAEALRHVEEAEPVRVRALRFLVKEMDRRGLWRHWASDSPKYLVPPFDLDDTACATIALRGSGVRIPDNRAMFLRNRDRSGCFYTWKITPELWLHPLRLRWFFTYTGARPRDVDAVVNANVLACLGHDHDTQAVPALLLNVLRNGTEESCDKWYLDPYVIWYFFSRALAPKVRVAEELIFSRMALREPTNDLQVALSISIYAAWNRACPSSLIDQLIAAQSDAGAWRRAPFYRGADRRWGSEELTTAFCLQALAAVRAGTR